MTWLPYPVEDADNLLALLGIPPAQFKLFMDSIIWAIKHTMRDIADIGLSCEHRPIGLHNHCAELVYSMYGGHQ